MPPRLSAAGAGGDVAAPEVGHRRDAGTLGDDVRVAELDSEGIPAVEVGALGPVTERLAVRADRAHVRRGESGIAHQRRGRLGERLAQARIERAQFVQ